jgi:hypothetical protein
LFLEASPYRDQLLALAKAGRRNLFFNRGGTLNQGAYLTPAYPDLIGVLNASYQQVAGRPLVPSITEKPTPEPPAVVEQESKATIEWLAEITRNIAELERSHKEIGSDLGRPLGTEDVDGEAHCHY